MPAHIRPLIPIALVALSCAERHNGEEHESKVSGAIAPPSLSVVAGAGGVITTLARYDNGAAHPGVNAIDVGAGGGTSVWHQLDYLPSEVAGGWVYVLEGHEPGYCSQFYPGSPYYNGAKIYVFTYFYAIDGTYLGWHREAYQHVDPHAPNMNAWWTWNNAGASVPAWPSAHLTLGVGVSEGLFVGTITPIRGFIYNGPGGGLCTTGSHLHQEGDGARSGRRFVGESVAERYSDMHLFVPAGGYPSPGAPPSLPLAETAPPPPPPPAEEPAPSECDQLGYAGRCEAGTLLWCANGAIERYDCAALGLGCGWQNDDVGNNCVSGCGELDFLGACWGSSLRWCENGVLKRYECANIGRSCGWESDSVGYNCR
jgi:hypothetical protein